MDFNFKKKFGQNFLTDKNLLDSIVSLSLIDDNATVLEIGPGAGALTTAIAKKAKRVVSFEIDKELKPILDENLKQFTNSQIVFKDFMKLSDLEIVAEYPVIPEIAGMAQISLIGDYYYVTVSTDVSGSQDYKTMIRADSLESLATGEFDVLYDLFGCDGTPYNITHFDGHFYLAEHRISNCRIWQFDVNNNEIENITKIY